MWSVFTFNPFHFSKDHIAWACVKLFDDYGFAMLKKLKDKSKELVSGLQSNVKTMEFNDNWFQYLIKQGNLQPSHFSVRLTDCHQQAS